MKFARIVSSLLAAATLGLFNPASAETNRTSDAATPVTQSVIAPAKTADRKAKVDSLFSELRKTSDPKQGTAIVRRIWQAWTYTGNVDVDALMKQVNLAMQDGHAAEALGAVERVVEIAPDYAEGWNRRATLHFLMGNHDKSVADIKQTLSLEPRHFGALSGLSQIHAAAGNWRAALKSYEAALDANPFLPNRKLVLKRLQEKALGSRL